MEYCCNSFRWAIESIGKKGMAIIPAKIGIYNCFVIQSRSNDKTIEHDSHNVAQQTIHFCPWCGKDLIVLIKENLKEYERLKEIYKDSVLNLP